MSPFELNSSVIFVAWCLVDSGDGASGTGDGSGVTKASMVVWFSLGCYCENIKWPPNACHSAWRCSSSCVLFYFESRSSRLFFINFTKSLNL